jgi:hypothetical protein
MPQSSVSTTQLAQLQAQLAKIQLVVNQILALLQQNTAKEATIMSDLTQLTADVATNTTVTGSALTLIQGFAAELAAAGTDPVALKALQTQLEANDTALAAAVAQNTPAATSPAGPATPAAS